MIKILSFLLLASTCFGQLTMQTMQPFFNGAPSVLSFYPTNDVSAWLWLDEIPQTTIIGASGTALCGNNIVIGTWTNIVRFYPGTASHMDFAGDGTTHAPTNFTSGGGFSSVSPRVNFAAGGAGFKRLLGNSFPAPLPTFSILVVCNNTGHTANHEIEYLFTNGNTFPFIRFNDGKLEMSAGTTLTGAATIGTGYYVIYAEFNGASSVLKTNGVTYVSGNAGSTGFLAAAQPVIAQPVSTPIYIGNILRVASWTNMLSSANQAAALAQAQRDFQ